MEGIPVEYFTSSVGIFNNEEKYECHSYINYYNEPYTCDSIAHMFHP